MEVHVHFPPVGGLHGRHQLLQRVGFRGRQTARLAALKGPVWVHLDFVFKIKNIACGGAWFRGTNWTHLSKERVCKELLKT